MKRFNLDEIKSLTRENYEIERRWYRIQRRHLIECIACDSENFVAYTMMYKQLSQGNHFSKLQVSCDRYDESLCFGWVIDRAMNKQNKDGIEAWLLVEKFQVFHTLAPFLQVA
ncbi:hypothetical protein [Enterovibrio paralichthyis]|uniref:hypothetical protein n=1 Tax=Enterovibrio paralichthyis TaxID=2853805 RepID=UPI001C44F3EA|nr:hypothetical protein [Enterovibrio paralichthyis]MBV7300761.1 hypothetical protein [Enterovibrio paralichthyis]